VDVAHLDSVVALQLDSIRAGGVTTEELTKAKNSFRARFISSRETTLDKSEQLQHYAMFHGSLSDIDLELDRVLAVTADDLRRVASRYFDPANAVVMIVKAGGGQ
jgi:predicted Zn-dependent peptidase